MTGPPVSRDLVHEELERARAHFQGLVQTASAADLRRPTNGTRWTNEQLLFHMVLGYGVVRTLLPLVRTLGRLPDGFSLVFARGLNEGTRPFHVVNYWGGCAGALVLGGMRLTGQMNRTVASLHRSLDRETSTGLDREMHFPVGWDPFFSERMTLLDVYHYGTLHFWFHRAQLTLPEPR